MGPQDHLIVALDVASAAAARKIVAAVGDSASAYKVGMQLYTAEGPPIVRELVGSGRRVFLDLKYHDIPNTVAAAVREAAQLGVSMLTVHASGGGKMLRAAAESAEAVNPDLLVLAVTVLTSMDDSDLETLGLRGGVPGAGVAAGRSGALQRLQGSDCFRAGMRRAAGGVRPRIRHRDARCASGRKRARRSGPRGHPGRSHRGRSHAHRGGKADHRGKRSGR